MTQHEFRLADIGEGLEDAEIVRWLVNVGDHVGRDQPIVEVMTDKSNAELPAPEQGTIVELGGSVGDIITVGELIAIIETETASTNSALPTPSAGTAPLVDAPAQVETAPLVVAHPQVQTAPGVAAAPSADAQPIARPKAAPSTRRVAAERNIDLTLIRGTGPGGRILLADLDSAPAASDAPGPRASAPLASGPFAANSAPAVESRPTPQAAPLASPSPTPGPPAVPSVPSTPSTPPLPSTPSEVTSGSPLIGTVPLRGVRRVVARNMAQSWSEIPHIHAFDEIDAEPLLQLRSQLRATSKPAFESITPLAFFVAAVARALRTHPQANASINIDDETITHHNGVNVGVAVAAEHGLVVPVLYGADRLDFETLSLTLAELVRAARAGELSPEHFRGGTVTITNFGSLGGNQATPLIRPSESCIFGFGAIAARPFVIDGQVVARKTMPTVIGADHRLLDGDVTTSLLNAVGSSLAAPLELVL